MHRTLGQNTLIATLFLLTLLPLQADNEWIQDFAERFIIAQPAEFNSISFWSELYACLAAGQDINSIDYNAQHQYSGVTMLYCTARLGDVELVEALLDAGANPDLQEYINLNGPLHTASEQGHLEIVELLCSYDASINLQNNQGQTPLHKAALKGHTEVCRQLLAYGARTDIRDRNAKLAVHYAQAREYMDIVELLS